MFACLSLLWIASGGLLNSPIVTATDTQFLETSVIAAQNIIHVPEDYPKIQDAINAANPDDIIQVKAGMYYEMLLVGKPLTIMGEDKNTTIIVGRIQVFSNHVVVKGFTIRNAPTLFCGITVYTNSNVISENIVKDNGEDGIWLWYNTKNNTISGNLIEGNTFCGMSLDNSTNNMITGNVITNHEHGMMLTNSENNTIVGNTFVTNAHCGFHLRFSSNNVIYHNNFIDSPVHSDNSTNTWDNGAEGNYWSSYRGEDIDGDGVGDTLIPHLGLDSYPLMERWSMLRIHNAFVWNAKTYQVATYSNCTVASFGFNHPAKQISFNVTGAFGKVGFCNVTIPKLLLLGPWQVLMNGTVADFTKAENETHSSLYFTFSFSTQMVEIVGTKALDMIPPTADAGSDQIVNETTQVTFDGSHSWDNVDITNYTWTFVDNTPRTLTGIFPSYTFNTPGNYTVTLKVIDAVGNYDTDTMTIRVLDVPEAFPWWSIGLIVAAVGGVALLAVIFWKRKTRENSARTRARSSKR